MTSNWRIIDERYQEYARRAAEVARTPRIARHADGTVSIYVPLLQKLLDPHNTCLCPGCLLPELRGVFHPSR